MMEVEETMSAIAVDNDVDRFGEERGVNIQLCPLALCPAQDIHPTLQDGELKPVAKLVWEDARFTAKDCCTYTLLTKFQSDDVARRFHGDCMQQLSQRKFARLRKLARVLSDKGCLLLALSLATDRVMLEAMHEKPVQGAQSRDARVAMVIKAMKKELLPRWSRDGEEVELRFHIEDGRSQLDRKLSDLEETHRNSVQRSENQYRMIQQTIERFASMVKEEGQKMTASTLDHDLMGLSAPTKPIDQRQQKTLGDRVLNLPIQLSPGDSKTYSQKSSAKFSTTKYPAAASSLTVGVAMMEDEVKEMEPETEVPDTDQEDSLFRDLDGKLLNNEFFQNECYAGKIMRPILGQPTLDEGSVFYDPLMKNLEMVESTHHDLNQKKDPFPEHQYQQYEKVTGAAGADVDTTGGDGQKSPVFPNLTPKAGVDKKDATHSPSSTETASQPPGNQYNSIPPDSKNQPPGADQLRGAGTGSNDAQSHPHYHKNPPAGPSVHNDSPRVPQYGPDSNFQQRTSDPDAHSGTPSSYKSQPSQSRLPATNAKTLAEEPRTPSHPNDGKYYQRQSRTRMVERLEWASAMASVEETPSPRARRGMDTVLCLDNSLSMQENGAFQEMKTVALDFIEGLEEMAESSLEENVAVVSMGGGATVLQHLTNDYNLVRTAIESLEPQGWTPFFETLIVGMQCLNRRGKVIAMGKSHRIRARIVCLTDGKPSDETTVAPENHDPTMTDTNFRVMFVQLMPQMKSHTHDIYWVPVGKDANKSMLQILEKLKVGTVVETEARKRLHRHFFIQNMLGHMLNCKSRVKGSRGKKEGQSEDTDDADTADISEYEPFFMALASDVNEEEKEEVRRCLRASLSKPPETSPEVEEEEFARAHVNPSKPPLGTRVVRGPDWRWGEQDGGMPGTVVKHRRRDGMVEVQWDHGGREVYRYEQGGSIDVMEAPEGTSPVFLEDRMICVGANVQRGPDWSSGNEDGGPGGMGVVIDCKDDGRVKVAWKNGTVGVYKFGKHNLYDVFVCDDAHKQPEFGSQASGNTYNFPLPGDMAHAAEPAPKDGVTLWQWQDDQGEWRLYSQEEQGKLAKAYLRRDTGSCLISRGTQTYRVLFAENVERCVQDKSTRAVKKILVTKEEYEQLAGIGDVHRMISDASLNPRQILQAMI